MQVLASKYEIVSTEECDTEIEVVLEETIYYFSDWKIQNEEIEHILTLMYASEEELVVTADAYYEEYSEFISASYVNPYAVSLADEEGSDECIVYIAGTQVGYYEKATNASLDSFTANAGNGNYTKYGAWYGLNGQPWCAMFVSWCANQANVSTSIIKKTASCDTSMNFFKANGRFYASSAYGGSYTPKVGDIFFTGPNSSDATHTGIVVGVSSSTITVIHGNSTSNGQDQVRKSTYSLTSTSLLGFGNPNYGESTHSYEWNSNSSSHWSECSVCGCTSSTASHSLTWKASAAKHWKACSICGYTSSSAAHTSTWNWSTTSHWKTCSTCGYSSLAVAHTWVSMGSYNQCSGCGVKNTELPSTASLSLDEDIAYTQAIVLE